MAKRRRGVAAIILGISLSALFGIVFLYGRSSILLQSSSNVNPDEIAIPMDLVQEFRFASASVFWGLLGIIFGSQHRSR
jgi:hypothetical protein